MKLTFNRGVILFMLLLCLGCYEKEITLDRNSNDEIQNWYNNLYPQGLSIRTPENEVFSLGSTPLWEERHEEIKDYVVAHQIPLSLTGLFQAVPLETQILSRSASNAFSSPSSLTSLVILDDHTTDEKIGFLMTVVPSDKYYRQYGLPEENFNYFERSLDFDGYVLYHNLTGEYSNGWKYTEGIVTHTVTTVTIAEREMAPLTRSYTDCAWDGFYYLILDCRDAYAGVGDALEYKGTYCKVVDMIPVLTYTCENVSEWGTGGGGGYDPGPGGGSGGGSDSGNNNNNQEKKMSEKAAKLAAKHSLGDSIKKFNEALEEMLIDCGYETLYNYVVSGGKIKDILIEPSLGGEASFSDQERLKFQSYANITTSTVKHEVVHMFQKRYNNIETYDKRMEGMMEFERQLLQDIHEFNKIDGDWDKYYNYPEYSWGGYGLGEVGKRKYLEKYYNYLSDFTNKGTIYPSSIDNNLFLEVSHYFGEICLSYASKYGYQYGLSDYQRCIEKMIEIIEKNCKE